MKISERWKHIDTGVYKRCRPSLLTRPIAPLVYEPKCGLRGGGVAGPQPMRTAVHITWHGAQINFGDLTPYLTYASTSLFMSFAKYYLWFSCGWSARPCILCCRRISLGESSTRYRFSVSITLVKWCTQIRLNSNAKLWSQVGFLAVLDHLFSFNKKMLCQISSLYVGIPSPPYVWLPQILCRPSHFDLFSLYGVQYRDI